MSAILKQNVNFVGNISDIIFEKLLRKFSSYVIDDKTSLFYIQLMSWNRIGRNSKYILMTEDICILIPISLKFMSLGAYFVGNIAYLCDLRLWGETTHMAPYAGWFS